MVHIDYGSNIATTYPWLYGTYGGTHVPKCPNCGYCPCCGQVSQSEEKPGKDEG